MEWQQSRPQRAQRRSVRLPSEAAYNRTAYFPQGSVRPQRLHRTTQPGARRSYSANSSSVGSAFTIASIC